MAKDASGNDDQESQNLPPALPALETNSELYPPRPGYFLRFLSREKKARTAAERKREREEVAEQANGSTNAFIIVKV